MSANNTFGNSQHENYSFLSSVWEQPHTLRKCITISIILPCGIGVGDFLLRVIEDGDVLELVVDGPYPLLDIRKMHAKLLKPGQSNDEGLIYHHPKGTWV